MELKYDYDQLDIQGLSIQDVIAIFQAWETEHPEAQSTNVGVYSDGDSAYLEVAFCRPFTEEELAQKELNEKLRAERQEAAERAEYERLKAKYEN